MRSPRFSQFPVPAYHQLFRCRLPVAFFPRMGCVVVDI
uniref:Uncharacterized protein n=1 Tax=Nelumbo nucifera TaxID=4432 RepID=A0A822YIB8_NELNU|nr:TPA_asm: hypothetical protein HUJ06_010072 [Nelumbo nucifera]